MIKYVWRMVDVQFVPALSTRQGLNDRIANVHLPIQLFLQISTEINRVVDDVYKWQAGRVRVSVLVVAENILDCF